ncbi:hypothetical protein [Teredinibacter sp. KSP-S5-2]|uniref:hypothetical protein n=1 Tax=Teredinibacter sp. KSP-S5-2 TaxID=3034506 RepID=UPI002934D643|nr:hypothetical protein [Teredinibacter sp. KSP-S5-2]WNO08267.1 hypothetical protein P5V12_14950 [Teredinibacter sp. KSP-S5-2]
MKKVFIGLFLSICSLSSVAAEKKIDPAVLEFAQLSGIEGILQSTMTQTRDSLQATMIDMSAGLKAQYPNLTAEQEKMLDDIMGQYVSSIINSIDVKTATYIYSEVVANGMSKSEVSQMNDFYKSPEGKNMQRVVGEASQELNEYILNTMSASVKVAQAKLVQDLNTFKASVTTGQQ